MSATGLSLITAAFEALQVYQPGDAVSNADAESARGILNRMLGLWAQQHLTIPALTRTVVPLLSGKGSPTTLYTVGIGGDINIPRPPNQAAVLGAAWYLTASTVISEIPVGLMSDQQYASWPSKSLTGPQPIWAFYNPTYLVSGYGSLSLMPVPDNTLGSLVLYLEQPLGPFTDLTTTFQLAEGMEETIVSNLARKLAKPFGAMADAELVDAALSSLRILKRANFKWIEIPNYFGGSGSYDIDTDQTY